jgi:hypothetical protein
MLNQANKLLKINSQALVQRVEILSMIIIKKIIINLRLQNPACLALVIHLHSLSITRGNNQE